MNKEKYKEFFKVLTGFFPYEYQKDCYTLFTKGRNNILQAPTGSGKTWGSLVPFVYCWKDWKEGKQNREDYPRKLIYSLPLRTLANSLYYEISSKIGEEFPELNIKVKLQTGEFPNDSFFEGDIIFTTIDQTLSNILGIPLSLPKRLANINAGAVISSYLVFDEFHLLDPKASLKTTITLLESLKNISPFCLMTATLSENFLKSSSKYLNAEITKVNICDYNNFASIKNKTTRIINIVEKILTVENIIKRHKQKSIVICNTVDRCVEVFKELLIKKENGEINSEILCIHSRFFHEDRKKKEKSILELFGKDSDSDVILVSTQVIEVGLDISCDTMHTEISPINSLVQRAGRCVRWFGKGELYIYDLPEKHNRYLPYKSELSKTTFNILKEYQHRNLDFYLSQEIIEKVLAEYETNIFNEIQRDSVNTWRDIHDSWRTGNQAYVRKLIRDIRSINIVLLPRNYKTDSLYKFESVSINPYSLKKKIENLLDAIEGEQPIIAMKLEESNLDFDEPKVLEKIEPTEIYIENIIVLNSNAIGYNSEFGIDFSSSNGFQSKEKKLEKKYEYQIDKDTYEQHIQWMLNAYLKIHDIWFPFSKIRKTKYKQFNFEEILTYIIIMHDYGKLNTIWQKIVNDYQIEKSAQNKENFEPTFLAHTDYNPSSYHDFELMKLICKNNNVNKKPPHAGVGAFISLCVLPSILKLEKNKENHSSLLKIVVTTINRHHTAFAKTFPAYKISNEAVVFINENLVKKNIPSYYISNTNDFPFIEYRSGDLESQQIQFNDILETFLYFLFVRTLRLCDQRSFHESNK